MNISLTGKVAIITGAASGIGLAAVAKFLESGARGVVAVDLSEPPAALLQSPAAQNGRLQFVRGDVAQESTAAESVRTALQHFGRVDTLINNAAVTVVKALHEHTPDEWDAVMNVNVKAGYWSAKYVIAPMIKAGGGVILNTGSISGCVGIPGQGAYAASKGAIHQMTRQMAIEYAPHNIRVNAIGCGTIDTPLVHRAAKLSGNAEKFWAMLKDNHPIGRIASADEVAAFMVYLASDLASFFTGAILMMDGGFTAR